MMRRITSDQVPALRRDPVDDDTLTAARRIVADVQMRGEVALREHAERLGDLSAGAPLIIGREALQAALASLSVEDTACLKRTALRITRFAEAHRAAVGDIEVPVPGGRAGCRMVPVDRAGCYAPGGRFPLPSSVLMTACTARAAGVVEVWVASPKPTTVTLAAAAIAGADALLAVGGAQAIAALAYGAGPVPAVDAIVGPGNRWVTAAKQLVSGRVAIDMLAGPSELVVLADGDADPVLVAADLLAQAEHDPDALPILVTDSVALADGVDRAIADQLSTLPTANTAAMAVEGGFTVIVANVAEGVAVADRLAPEHLALHVDDATSVGKRLRHYGALFVGAGAAEVLGDYGAGPNHVLPTGGTARSTGALSVLAFLRAQTWLEMDGADMNDQLAVDSVRLARMEGLEAHARAAEYRLKRR